MTLRRVLIWQSTAIVLCTLVLGITAILGIAWLRRDFQLAQQANTQTRHIYEVGQRLQLARERLNQSGGVEAARAEVTTAAARFAQGEPTMQWMPATADDAAKLDNEFHSLLDSFDALPSDDRRLASMVAAQRIDRVLAGLANLSSLTRQTLAARDVQQQTRHRITLGIVAGCAAVVIISVITLARRQYRAILRPLQHVRSTARQVSRGNLSKRASESGLDEFDALSRDFNHMVEQLQALKVELEARVEAKSQELLRSQQLASLGYLAAGVAHEINNPLGIIAGYAERSIAKLDRNDPQSLTHCRRTLEIAKEEAFRCKEITQRLLALAKPGEALRAPVSMQRVAADIVQLLADMPDFETHPLTLSHEAAMDDAVLAHEGELRQVLLNLIINAREASPDGGAIRVRVWHELDAVCVSVIDSGVGISQEHLAEIFEPFVSGRAGTGLGLSLAQKIVTAHRGSLTASSDGDGHGSTFTLRLPLHVEASHV